MIRCIRDNKGRFAKHVFVRNPERDNCRPKSDFALIEAMYGKNSEAYICNRCGYEFWASLEMHKIEQIADVLSETNELIGDVDWIQLKETG
jgi:hypothetical protein